MRVLRFVMAAGLSFGLLASMGARADAKPPEKEKAATCGNHGTSVEFKDTPSEAAREAQKEQKLVFVLHVSGNFEDPRFT